MLLIATEALADMVVWHLLVASSPGERISYNDPRIAKILAEEVKGISLRTIESKRHIVGW